MIFIIILLSNLFNVKASELSPCPQKEVVSFKDFEAIQKKLDWHGATGNTISNAPCKTTVLPSDQDLENYISQKNVSVSKSISKIINGVSFKNESPELLLAFEKLTKAKDQFGNFDRPSDQKNFQKEFNINPACQKVSCAVEKIWGRDLGYKILYLLLKYNFNSSEYAYMDSDRLKIDEMNDVVKALEDLPKQVLPVNSKTQRLTHYSRGYKLKGDGDGVAANAVVMLFDNWSNEGNPERQYSVFHEMSHNIGSKLKDLDLSNAWLKLSDWVKKGDDWSHGEKACFVTEYSLTNPVEDFAESVSTYRYNGNLLKNTCSKKYELIKEKVFKGVEYLSESTCSEFSKSISENIKDKTFLNLDKLLENVTSEKLITVCNGQVSTYPISNQDKKLCAQTLLQNMISEDQLVEILQENKLAITEIQKQKLKNFIADKYLTDEDKLTVINKIENDFDENRNKIILAEFASKAPRLENGKVEGLDVKSLSSYTLGTICKKEMWSLSDQDRKKCFSNYIIDGDKTWSQFGSNRYLSKLKIPENLDAESKKNYRSKFYEVASEKLQSTNVLDEALSKQSQELKKQVYDALNSKNRLLKYGSDDWKKIEPKEFCQKNFVADDFVKKYYLPKDESQFPKFEEWCIAKQSTKKKRFDFSEDELKEYINSVIK